MLKSLVKSAFTYTADSIKVGLDIRNCALEAIVWLSLK